jgi:tRNA-binding protein
MQIFYNQKGIGDVLLIPIKDGNREQIAYERFGDVVKIFDKDSNEVLGYNIFEASKYISFHTSSQIELTTELVDKIHHIFKDNQLNDTLEVDLSPKFVVGYVKEKTQHENADKLSVCQVDVGDQVLQIVCGAPNVEAGQRVVVAKPGATMPSGMAIKEAELRGVPSSGMICSAKELNLPDAPKEKGILVLTEDYEVGTAFTF